MTAAGSDAVAQLVTLVRPLVERTATRSFDPPASARRAEIEIGQGGDMLVHSDSAETLRVKVDRP